jgi:hypothetical protein
VAVLASVGGGRHARDVALTPEQREKVMAELWAVSASATSKREEAANLARIWGRPRPAPAPPERAASA